MMNIKTWAFGFIVFVILGLFLYFSIFLSLIIIQKKRQHYIDLIMKKNHTIGEIHEILDYELQHRQSKPQIKIFAHIYISDYPVDTDTIEDVIREQRWVVLEA